MPCEYTTINLKEKQRQEEIEYQKSERKKQDIANKKRALLISLASLGFDVSARTIDNDKTLIIGEKGD